MDLNVEHVALVEQIKAARTFDDLEAAFLKVAQITPTLSDPAVFGHKLFTPDLDAQIPHIARALGLADAPHRKSNDNVCILATQFYGTGGHTRVARDIAMGLGPDARPLIILTNATNTPAQYRNLRHGDRLGSDMAERAFLLLSAGAWVDRAIELYMILKAARPTRILLMCHPFDIVAVVGCWPFRDVVEFVHHCDHVPALGAAAPWSAHVDLTYTCHRACRASGLDAVYAGMTSAVVGAPPHALEPGRLRLATCGDQRKYDGAGHYRWADYAVAALSQPGAALRHIGAVSDAFQAEVRDALSATGIDPDRYQFVGPKPSLPAELIDQQTDVYIESYPVAGGKATLEAMLLDVPVVVPMDADMPPLSRFSLPLPRYVEIQAPGEIGEGVARALELGAAMRDPDQVAVRDREVARFADFVAARAVPPADGE